jgi:hypothetical protein
VIAGKNALWLSSLPAAGQQAGDLINPPAAIFRESSLLAYVQ